MIIENKYIRLSSIGSTTKRLCKSNFWLLLLLLVVANMVACSSVHIDYDGGQALSQRTYILETSLHLGKSGMNDVLQVFGKPNGKGKFMLPTDTTGRKTWSYFYQKGFTDVEITGPRQAYPGGKNPFAGTKYDTNLNIDGEYTANYLFIYFDSNDIYDGYIWFSVTDRTSTYPK